MYIFRIHFLLLARFFRNLVRFGESILPARRFRKSSSSGSERAIFRVAELVRTRFVVFTAPLSGLLECGGEAQVELQDGNESYKVGSLAITAG
jgi:hypothetical protein